MEWFYDEEFWSVFASEMFDSDRWLNVESEIADLEILFNVLPGSKVLDSCCGVGRHTLEFARKGYDTWGMDLTQSYLDSVKEQADEEGLTVSLERGDLRTWVKKDYFDLIVNMYTSFGYFESEDEDAKAMTCLYESLRPGGRLVIEVTGKELLARRFKEDEWFERNGRKVLTQYSILDDWSRLQNRWVIIEKGKEIDYTFSHRIYSALEMKRLLIEAGFTDISVYGSLDGRAYDHNAETLIVSGVRPKQ